MDVFPGILFSRIPYFPQDMYNPAENVNTLRNSGRTVLTVKPLELFSSNVDLA